jgi:heavy metal translocating P-type ATPase
MILEWAWRRKDPLVAAVTAASLLAHLLLGSNIPLYVALAAGGLPLVYVLARKALRANFDADLLAGISIVTSCLLGEYLAGTIVVLMLSGGESLERYATAKASSILKALAKRMPSTAHREIDGAEEAIAIQQIAIDDRLVVHPHEICPADGLVVAGDGHVDESYLTGEPFRIKKTVGSAVLSGSINGDTLLKIRVAQLPKDSRFEKIMRVMQEAEQKRPNMRRIGDQLGAYYTPLALLIAVAAWVISGESLRFLAVLVVATPCPLLIAIPIAIIGSISLAAQRAIVVKNPVALEQISQCRTAIFDKTGTLTYGEPALVDLQAQPSFEADTLLQLVASLERYSKHPLAKAILTAAEQKGLKLSEVAEVHEAAGQGLRGFVGATEILVTSRAKLGTNAPEEAAKIPPGQGGLECVIVVDQRYAGLMRFHDAPRDDGHSFISHLGLKHQFDKVMILSGDRESEVRYLAEKVGIQRYYAQKSPEEKLAIVRAETLKAKTLYVGDGINDAPAMMAATVGMAMGQNSDITAEAASVVVLDSSLQKVDEFFHISRRLRQVVLQSAVGGMALSLAAMMVASAGYLSPVQGAITQEVIDVLAILNALRMAIKPKVLSDLG